MPFVVRTDNNPLAYVLTTQNLDATGHRWVGMLASFQFMLEYQKGADNGVADALSHVPICNNQEMVQSLLEGAFVGAVDRGEAEASEEPLCEHEHLGNEACVQATKMEAEASEELLCEHEHLGNEACVQATKMVLMHIMDWGEAQEADPLLATCRRWLCTFRDTPFPKRDALFRKYLGDNVNMKERCAIFRVCNGLIMSKGLLYISTMPKG